jgi:hydroxyacylglutathione hydrolase
MLLRHFYVEKIAHSSYLIGGKKTCAIVDPGRDIERYLEAAEEEGLDITHIIETHLHADFISGHIDLAEETGGTIYAPKKGNCEFDHVAVVEGSKFSIEDIGFHVIETAGHTPECLVYLVNDMSRGDEPMLALTGDTLFVADVGRPDIFPGRAEELAGKLYDNIHSRIAKIPGHCIVLPAHGAGSLCGKAIGSMKFSTIGYELKYNKALLIKDKNEFIRSLTLGMPPAPDHFGRCSEINRKGPVPVRNLTAIVPMEPYEFMEKMKDGKTVVVNTGDYATFGGQHIPGSFHIDINSNFPTFAGWILPPEKDILLVTDSPQQAEDAVLMLRRVGLDRTVGYLKGGTHAWVMAGYETHHIPQLSAKEVHEKLEDGEFVLLDVRTEDEYREKHVPGAVNILAMDLRTRYNELDPEKPLIAMCRTGRMASLACSILKQHDFSEVCNASGGITAYIAAGYLK